MEEDGSGQTRVLGIPSAPRVPPALSPDGRRVLVVSDGLWVFSLEGRSRRRLARGQVYGASWSPDGDRVAYAWDGGLSVISADGTGRLRLTRRGGDGDAAWSPDGRRIAYAAEDGLWVIGSDGRQNTHVARVISGTPGGPVWAPEGDRVALIGGYREAKTEDLYVVEIGRAPERLARNAGGVPTWSPDGAELAFLLFGVPFDPTNAGIVVVDARDGRLIRKLSGTADPPIWSHDGEHLLLATAPTFESGPKEFPQVLIMSREGSERRQLTLPYPDGGFNRPIGWIASDHATESPPRPAIEQLPRGARLLRVPHPVGVVSVAGPRVAIAPPSLEFESFRTLPPLLLWSLDSSTLDRRTVAGCRGLGWPTLSDGRIVFDCDNSYIDSISHSVRVFDRGSARPREVLVAKNTPGLLHSGVRVEGIAGRGGLVVVGTERILSSRRIGRTIWRLVGNQTRPLRRGLGAGLIVAADAGRVALQLGPRRVVILRPDGEVLRNIALAASAAERDEFVYGAGSTAALAGNRLFTLGPGRIDVYSTRTGRLERSHSVGRGARSVSAVAGLLAYVRGRAVRVRGLADGREVRFGVGGPLADGVFRGLYIDRPVHVDLAPAGLVYAYNVRTGPQPGRVVFVPREELERRLASR
jgi:Tol biopolymer transport system component